MYFHDSGLLCYLLGIQTVDHLKQHPLIGNIIENYVISELKKTYYNNGQNIPMYFWREQGGHEVDLIIEDNATVYPIEIKSSETIREGLFKSFDKWLDIADVEKGYLFYGGDTIQIDRRITCLPIGLL